MPYSAEPACDALAAAAVWQRVSPALPAYPAASAPASAPAPSVPSPEETLRRAVDDLARICRALRRCGGTVPGAMGRALTALYRDALLSLRQLLSAHYLLTGAWYQPPEGVPFSCAPPEVLRRLYRAETALARRCSRAAALVEDQCLRAALERQSCAALRRAERLAELTENALTNGRDLLK